ncbi:hypothetical protein F5146DRAFT_1003255 [Armillaria mellea]|nr:hypothetical protein F5146DRAFT_1003255 [Armillaria mellea]
MEATDVDWYFEGFFIDLADVRGLDEGPNENKSRQGEMVIEDVSGSPRRFKIFADHVYPIPDGSYALIGTRDEISSSDLNHWVVGKLREDGRFEKLSVFRSADDELQNLRELELEISYKSRNSARLEAGRAHTYYPWFSNPEQEPLSAQFVSSAVSLRTALFSKLEEVLNFQEGRPTICDGSIPNQARDCKEIRRSKRMYSAVPPFRLSPFRASKILFRPRSHAPLGLLFSITGRGSDHLLYGPSRYPTFAMVLLITTGQRYYAVAEGDACLLWVPHSCLKRFHSSLNLEAHPTARLRLVQTPFLLTYGTTFPRTSQDSVIGLFFADSFLLASNAGMETWEYKQVEGLNTSNLHPSLLAVVLSVLIAQSLRPRLSASPAVVLNSISSGFCFLGLGAGISANEAEGGGIALLPLKKRAGSSFMVPLGYWMTGSLRKKSDFVIGEDAKIVPDNVWALRIRNILHKLHKPSYRKESYL